MEERASSTNLSSVRCFYDPIPIIHAKHSFFVLPHVSGLVLRFESGPSVHEIAVPQDGLVLNDIYDRYQKGVIHFSLCLQAPQQQSTSAETSSERVLGTFAILRTANADWESRKRAFEQLYTESGKYHLNFLHLLIEFFIYHTLGVKISRRKEFLKSADKLRDDEILNLRARLAQPGGLSWFFSLAQNLRKDSPFSLSWMWLKEPKLRILHFIRDAQAEAILLSSGFQIGSVILRPSFTNPGHVSASFKQDGKICHGIYESPKIVRQHLLANSELLFIVIAAPSHDASTLSYTDKKILMGEPDVAPKITSYEEYDVVWQSESQVAHSKKRARTGGTEEEEQEEEKQEESQIAEKKQREECVEFLYHVKGRPEDQFSQIVVSKEKLNGAGLKAAIEEVEREITGNAKVLKIHEVREDKKIFVAKNYVWLPKASRILEVELEEKSELHTRK